MAGLERRQLIQEVEAMRGSDLTPEVRNEVTNEIRRQYLSAAKARRSLGWRPEFTLDEGWRRTIDWYQDFFRVRE